MSTQTVYFNDPADITNLQTTTSTQTTQIASMSGSISSLNTSSSTLDFDVSPVQFSDGLQQYLPLPFVNSANYDYFVIMRHGPRKVSSTTNARPYNSETSTGTLTAFGELIKPEYRPVSGDKVYNTLTNNYQLLTSASATTGVSSTMKNVPFTYIGFTDSGPLIQEAVPMLTSYLTQLMTGGKFPLTFDYISANNHYRCIQTAQIMIDCQKQFDKTGTYNPAVTLKCIKTDNTIVTNTVGGSFETGTWFGLPNGRYGLDQGDPWTMGGMFTGGVAFPGTSSAYNTANWTLPNGNASWAPVTLSNNMTIAGPPALVNRYDTLQGAYKIFRKYYQNFQARDMFGGTTRTSNANYFAEVRPGNPDDYNDATWSSLTGSFGGGYAFVDYLIGQYYTTGSAINKAMTPQEFCTLTNFNSTFLNPVADEQQASVVASGIVKAIYDWSNNTGTRFYGWTGTNAPSKVFYACNEQCIQSVVTSLGCTYRLGNQGYSYPQGSAVILIKFKNKTQNQQYNGLNAWNQPIIGYVVAPGIKDPAIYDTSPLVTRGANVYLQNSSANKGLIKEAYDRVTPYVGNPNTYAGHPYYGWSPYDWGEVVSNY
jgi:hypothetical protein